MKINETKYIEEASDRLENAIGHAVFLPFMELIHRFREKTDLSSVDMFRGAFGRQQTTKNYSHRQWIWVFTSDDGLSTINCLVNNHQGISWEYDRDSERSGLLRLKAEIVEALTKE